MNEIGVAHGRFQVFHNDHLKYVLAAKARCRLLVVGITNPDPDRTRQEASDPRRSRPENNPLTYFERYRLVTACLLEAGLNPRELAVVPFPINEPRLYAEYLPMNAVFHMTVYDAWGRAKQARFAAMGLRVDVLWEKPETEKGITGTQVRERMRRGEPWEHMVPPVAVRLLKTFDLPDRLRRIAPEKTDARRP